MSYPLIRHRRLRRTAALRELVRETVLTAADFMYPIFVTHGRNVREEVKSMPGVFNFSIDRLGEEIERVREAGVKSIMLFGIPEFKDEIGSSAYDPNGIVQEAIREVKRLAPDLVVAADTCLCEYTDHGHCGIVRRTPSGGADVANDESLELLAKTAVSQADAGADIIAPSNMMDGFVSAIRGALDVAGHESVPILSYSVKYASAYYGPFRDAAQSATGRRTRWIRPMSAKRCARRSRMCWKALTC